MAQRRDVMKLGGAAALVGQFAGFGGPAMAQEAPLFKFGVISDPQYAPVVPNLTLKRYYANTLWKESLYTLGTTLAGFAFAVAFGLGLGPVSVGLVSDYVLHTDQQVGLAMAVVVAIVVQALHGLHAAGEPSSVPAVRRALEWANAHQTAVFSLPAGTTLEP